MKQPIQIEVRREHGNVGDVVTTLVDARGERKSFHVPGDCTPYSAITALAPFLERSLNSEFEAADPEPEKEPEPEMQPEGVAPTEGVNDGLQKAQVEGVRPMGSRKKKPSEPAPEGGEA